MKIGESLRPFIDSLGLREEKAGGDVTRPAFQEVLQAQVERIQRQELQQLLQQIEMTGKALEKTCSWRLWMTYKEQIRRFLEVVLREGYQNQERQGFDSNGRRKLYRIISQIDERMAALAEELLREEKDRIKILSLIGDLNGLLLNLYF